MKRFDEKGEDLTTDPKEKPYAVGYGQPPVESQFQKGQSGNPAGRPKASKPVNARIRDELNICVAALDGGQQIVLTKKRAVVRSIIRKALAGDPRAAAIALQFARANDPKDQTRPIFLRFGNKRDPAEIEEGRISEDGQE
jgi:hypothetical protein